MQYRIHMSDGQSILISPEDFGKLSNGNGTLCPVLRQDAKRGSDETVWVNPAHIVWISR